MQIREAGPGDERELVRLFTTLDEETSFMPLESDAVVPHVRICVGVSG